MPEKFLAALKKYKYVLLVILIGILLMTMPFGTKANEKQDL